MLKVTCPECASTFPIAAGFLEADGKRLAAQFTEFEPVLGRSIMQYLSLFKPSKSSLRISRALAIVEDLLKLVRTGSVCADERSGAKRPASHALWAAGIEQMLSQGGIATPLANHNYLRRIVYALADKADGQRERERDAMVRVKRPVGSSPAVNETAETQLRAKLAFLRQQLEMGIFDQQQYDNAVSTAVNGCNE